MPRKIKICIEEGCNNVQTTKEYCRLHYLKNWKTLKLQEKKKAAKKLNRYVEGIMKRNLDSDTTSSRQRHGSYEDTGDLSPTEEVDGLIEDLGYSDPETLDEIISNLKLDR